MNHQNINRLSDMLGKMKPGPYEYWDEQDNDLLAAECTGNGNGYLIAGLAGIVSMRAEFKAIAALLNAAPEILRLARVGLDSENSGAVAARQNPESPRDSSAVGCGDMVRLNRPIQSANGTVLAGVGEILVIITESDSGNEWFLRHPTHEIGGCPGERNCRWFPKINCDPEH